MAGCQTAPQDVGRQQHCAGDYRLSLVIPAWNEEATIGQALDEALAALTSLTAAFEIIIVDDGSSDRTAEIVRAKAQQHAGIRLIQHAANRGYGAALRTGFDAARFDLVAFTDADCQFHLGDLEYMLPLSRRYDIVNGSRINRQDPPLRLFASWGYNSLIQLLLGSSVHDVDCALKVIRREALQKILPQAANFFANTEMFTAAAAEGLSVVEVGVRHRPRAAGVSKVSWRAIPQTLNTLLPFWWNTAMFAGRQKRDPGRAGLSWLGLLLLAFIAGWQLFVGLQFPLVEPDESRYAEIGREMLVNDEWIIPTLINQPYLDKPPLFYWLVAGSYRCFGISDWSARLVPATAALLTILAAFAFGRRIVGMRAAFLGSLALSLSAGFIVCGRFLILDSLLTLWVTLGLFAAYEACRGDKLRWTWWIASALCCGLGVLTKGPVALILCLPPVVLHAWLSRSPCRPLIRHLAAYVAICMAVALPWFVAIMLKCPDFLNVFVWEHHFRRFFDGVNHPEPFWFYLPILLLAGVPWSIPAVAWIYYQFTRSRRIAMLRTPADGFCVLWALWCVAFFSLSTCKLPTYVLPAAPALFLLFGTFLTFIAEHAEWGKLFALTRRVAPLWGGGLLCLGLIVLVWVSCPVSGRSVQVAVLETAVSLAVLAAIVVWRHKWSAPAAWALCAAVSFGFGYESTHRLLPDFAASRSPLAQDPRLVEMVRDPDITIVAYDRNPDSLAFYLNRDDIEKFEGGEIGELAAFLKRKPRTLMFAHPHWNPRHLQAQMTGATELKKFGMIGKCSVWTIEDARHAALAREAKEK